MPALPLALPAVALPLPPEPALVLLVPAPGVLLPAADELPTLFMVRFSSSAVGPVGPQAALAKKAAVTALAPKLETMRMG